MALDRWLGPLFDIAMALTRDPEPPRRPTARARYRAPEPIEGAVTEAVAEAEAAAETAAADEAETEAEAVTEAASGSASASDFVAEAEFISEAAHTLAPDTIDEAELVSDSDSDPDDDEPAPPVRSLSMARLLAAQGHVRRATTMLESLLAERPGDPTLGAALLALRASPDRAPRRARDDDDGLAKGDEIVAVRASERDVLLSWQVGDARIARGRKLLPEAADVAVRLVVFHRTEDFGVRREERERAVERAGEWLVADVPKDAWMTASVGLREGDRFVSLAHSTASRAP